jgi:hypothetical protein
MKFVRRGGIKTRGGDLTLEVGEQLSAILNQRLIFEKSYKTCRHLLPGILSLRQNSDHQCRSASNLGKMPPHDGVQDHARVRIVKASSAEKFTLLAKPADEFLQMLRSHSIRKAISAASKAGIRPLRSALDTGNRPGPDGHPSEKFSF